MAEEMQTYGQTNESVVIYQSADNAVRLDVQLAEETVWLSQKQMAQLFDTTPQNITLHIGNVYKCYLDNNKYVEVMLKEEGLID